MKTINILYVEDNPDYIEVFTRALRKMEGKYTLKIVNTGSEAINFVHGYEDGETLLQSDLKVVLLDLDLPGMNGFDVLQLIRANQRTRYLPIIIFSTSDFADDILKAYDLGANAYVVKPSGYREIFGVVKPMLDFWVNENV